MDKLQDAIFREILTMAGAPHGLTPEFEFRFHPTRKWRFDGAFPDVKFGVEVDGAVWTGGRHTRGAGFLRDQEKTNEAAVLGWRVFRFSIPDLKNGVIHDTLSRALENWGQD